jgi:hypothetical protein
LAQAAQRCKKKKKKKTFQQNKIITNFSKKKKNKNNHASKRPVVISHVFSTGIHAFKGAPDRPLLLSELTLEASSFFIFERTSKRKFVTVSLRLCVGGYGGDGPGGGGVRMAASAGVAGADGLGGVCGANNRADREGGPVRALPHRPCHTPSPFSSRFLFLLFYLLQALTLRGALSPRLQFFSARLRRQLRG